MNIVDGIRFFLGIGLLFIGLCVFFIQLIGVFKFSYVLNRMHSAAMGDTLGLGASLLGLMILSGFNFTTLKMALILVFLWFASPVSSHLIARLEVTTNEELEKYCEIRESKSIKESIRKKKNKK